jgi:hypothetical protein
MCCDYAYKQILGVKRIKARSNARLSSARGEETERGLRKTFPIDRL